MYKFKETTPDWLCYKANLDFTALPAIQKELLKLFLKTKKDTLVPYTSTFVEIGGHAELGVMHDNCPLLMAEMHRLNLVENFLSVAFISVDAAKEFPPHVDGWLDDGVDIALNGRCNSDIPHWINVNVLHRPETHHDKFRVAASIRFSPDPVDTGGKLWPHLIRQTD